MFIGQNDVQAQPCIATFPYTESFETNNGNWISGGTSSDWAWGSPAKPVISGAGGGSRCWITGGLINSFYNNSEDSWLQSPCFDFSSLQYPQVTFKIFWEIEKNYDGASFQYSTDGGNTWRYLGNTNSNSNCQGENWFNAESIRYLGNNYGWSGNIQSNNGSCVGGDGSNGWLTAKHTLAMLAGEPKVIFRFLFGSGSTCNAFDGFAIDDIIIEEAPANTATFTTNCISEKAVQFTGPVKCAMGYAWDFGDPASGAANTAAVGNSTHVFSAPGTYTVKLTTSFTTGPPVTVSNTVVIIGVTPSENWPGRCIGVYDATLSVLATGSSTGYTYLWNTDPLQTTAFVSNIQPGNYTVTVSAVNACNASAAFTINDSQVVQLSVDVQHATCKGKDGIITSSVSGGTPPYKYLWSTGNTQPNLVNIDSGYYDLDVTDAANCFTKVFSILVYTNNAALPVDLGEDFGICPGEAVKLNPGRFSSYLWQDGSAKADYVVTAPGVYYVQVTNGNGCTGTDSVIVRLDCSKIFFPTGFSPNADGKNETFGPLGNVSGIKNYSFSVYNRYGQLLFKTNDPFKKWDGNFNEKKLASGTYVWFADYKFRGRQTYSKGALTLVR